MIIVCFLLGYCFIWARFLMSWVMPVRLRTHTRAYMHTLYRLVECLWHNQRWDKHIPSLQQRALFCIDFSRDAASLVESGVSYCSAYSYLISILLLSPSLSAVECCSSTTEENKPAAAHHSRLCYDPFSRLSRRLTRR